MENQDTNPLADAELKVFFDGMFPHGVASADVLAELAPDGWEKSPLLACFHPSPEQVFRERLRVHRNLERLALARRSRKPDAPQITRRPEPTLRQVRADWKAEPVRVAQEVTELVGRCLWDVFSDGHDVVTSDGRLADLGSFRAAGGFLASYLDGKERNLKGTGYLRFYMGTSWVSCSGIHDRADLRPLYAMIFRRLKSLSADWVYNFPRAYVVDLSSLRKALEQNKPKQYSPSEAFAKEQEELQRQAELEKTRADLDEIHEQSRHEAMDCPPPLTVLAYQAVYGHDPKGWPPV